MSIEAIKDKYERPILSLRITITNKCNENCLYCHHDGMDDSQEEMNADEIYRICEIVKNIGVRKIRISGGEPLIRKDIVEIVSKIASLDFDDISITSNGTLLGKYAKDLKEAGLNRVNISLDTLNPETYKKVTTKNLLESAKNGILKAVEVGLYPVKINMVLMKGINENEVDDMFEFCKEHGIILQLIELMDSENCDDNIDLNPKVEANVLINNKEISLNHHTNNFVANSVFGMINSLNTDEDARIAQVDISKINQENLKESEARLTVNNKDVEINAFVKGILKETIYGMIKSLKLGELDINEIETINITVKK